jgi:glutamyl-tRNA synthetase
MPALSKIRVRFAPSPTGYLHIGGARTALFNWIFARQHQGTFVLRIEDTDVARSTEEAVSEILKSLKWLGLDWDEGPFYQSQRTPFYVQAVEKLFKEGKAYRCYCTSEELEQRRQSALKEGRKPKYDGTCRRLTSPIEGKPHAIRFKAPETGATEFNDIIKGPLSFQNNELDDLIILRSDGSPTYNLCVVMDDVTMGITHVIRGDDHLNNTPRQILLYQALNYPTPQFAHVPLILGTDKTRLSKRHGATAVMAYKDLGYLPEAVVNYLVRLGWSHKDEEIFTQEALLEKFRLEDIGKSPGVFNPEKLLWLNAHYIREKTNKTLCEMIHPEAQEDSEFIRLLGEVKVRARTWVELKEMTDFYFVSEVAFDEKAKEKFLKPENAANLKELLERLKNLETFSHADLEKTFLDFAKEKNLKLGDIAQPVRVALTGRTVSPGIFEVIGILGRDRVLARLNRAIQVCQ